MRVWLLFHSHAQWSFEKIGVWTGYITLHSFPAWERSLMSPKNVCIEGYLKTSIWIPWVPGSVAFIPPFSQCQGIFVCTLSSLYLLISLWWSATRKHARNSLAHNELLHRPCLNKWVLLSQVINLFFSMMWQCNYFLLIAQANCSCRCDLSLQLSCHWLLLGALLAAF